MHAKQSFACSKCWQTVSGMIGQKAPKASLINDHRKLRSWPCSSFLPTTAYALLFLQSKVQYLKYPVWFVTHKYPSLHLHKLYVKLVCWKCIYKRLCANKRFSKRWLNMFSHRNLSILARCSRLKSRWDSRWMLARLYGPETPGTNRRDTWLLPDWRWEGLATRPLLWHYYRWAPRSRLKMPRLKGIEGWRV